jgi:hypothetical protein
VFFSSEIATFSKSSPEISKRIANHLLDPHVSRSHIRDIELLRLLLRDFTIESVKFAIHFLLFCEVQKNRNELIQENYFFRFIPFDFLLDF